MSNYPNTSSPEKLHIEAWFKNNPMQKVTAIKMAAMTGLEVDRARQIMSRLRDRGAICSRKIGGQNHYWSGSYAEDDAEVRQALDLTPSRTLHNSSMSDPYQGEELRRNPGIPAERYAAFDLPSLVAGQRVPPRRITSGCTSNIPYVSRKDKCL